MKKEGIIFITDDTKYDGHVVSLFEKNPLEHLHSKGLNINRVHLTSGLTDVLVSIKARSVLHT